MIAFVYIWNDHLRDMHYIGCHEGELNDGYIADGIYERTIAHRNLSKYNPIVQAYYERSHDFSKQIILCETYLESRKLEQHFLESVDAAHNPDFYNRHNGGAKFHTKGRTISDHARQKKSEKQRGSNNHFYGKQHTPEARAKMRAAKLGKSKPHSELTKQKIKERQNRPEVKLKKQQAMLGRILTEDHKRKIGLTNRLNHQRKREHI